MQALDNAKTDGNALGYMKDSETDECEIEDDAEYQVSAVSEVGKPWTTRNVGPNDARTPLAITGSCGERRFQGRDVR